MIDQNQINYRCIKEIKLKGLVINITDQPLHPSMSGTPFSVVLYPSGQFSQCVAFIQKLSRSHGLQSVKPSVDVKPGGHIAKIKTVLISTR